MRVELLKPGHLAQYRALMLEAYDQAPDAFTSTAAERAAEPDSYWLARMADSKGLGLAWGAFLGEALVGTVALEFSAKPKTRHKALLIGMYVSPGARGKGAGAALLHSAIAQARAKPGLRAIKLNVTEGNSSAIALYERAGFQAYGVEPQAILTGSGYKGKVLMHLALV